MAALFGPTQVTAPENVARQNEKQGENKNKRSVINMMNQEASTTIYFMMREAFHCSLFQSYWNCRYRWEAAQLNLCTVILETWMKVLWRWLMKCCSLTNVTEREVEGGRLHRAQWILSSNPHRDPLDRAGHIETDWVWIWSLTGHAEGPESICVASRYTPHPETHQANVSFDSSYKI